MKKPIFYQAILEPIEGNVLDHVYPHLKDNGQLSLSDRMGSEEALCPDCGGNEWMLLPKESVAVKEGGKPYCECLGCGSVTHL